MTERQSRSPTVWDIALSAWIVQDGNYPDFYVGEVAEFAIEFWIPEGVHVRPAATAVSSLHESGCLYDAVADVVLHTDDITVLDIGVLVYGTTSSLDADFSQHSRYALKLGLGVDPFFYFEGLAGSPGIPALIYSWRILSILRQTAPFIETVVQGQRTRYRDPNRLGYEPISATNAWTDDGGYGEYILRCERIAVPSKRRSATAT